MGLSDSDWEADKQVNTYYLLTFTSKNMCRIKIILSRKREILEKPICITLCQGLFFILFVPHKDIMKEVLLLWMRNLSFRDGAKTPT